MAKKIKTDAEEPLEKKLWKAADKLRKNMDAAEYKHVVLGLIFLKYISDAFEELHSQLKAYSTFSSISTDGLSSQEILEIKQLQDKYAGADPEDKNEYLAEKVFYVPNSARWTWLQDKAKLPSIGKDIDDAMDAIERDNPSLKGVLPKVYAQEKLDKGSLGGLVDLISTATIGTKEAQSKDILGRVFEYFLGEFALAEGKKGGQFYTPEGIVRLLVEMLEPYEGRVFDPCCGSGGMFVQSEKFIKSHQDYYKKNDPKKIPLNLTDRISIYGQESNQTTWRLAKMNLSIRGIDSSNVKWNNEGSFLNDAHKDLKADFIIANPPFNDSDWSGDLLRTDGRWLFGKPPVGNANYAWIQHFLFHLAPSGTAGFLLSNGALSSNGKEEFEIRKNIVDYDLLDCIMMLPTQLFYNTQISVSVWFLTRSKESRSNGIRKGKSLFIDARKLGVMTDRTKREFTDEDIALMSNTYRSWKNGSSDYEDKLGFCKSTTIEEIAQHNYALVPGRYVGFDKSYINDFDVRLIQNEITEIKERLEQINRSGKKSLEILNKLANGSTISK